MSEGGTIRERSNDGWTFRYWISEKGNAYTNYDCERRLELAIWAVSRWFSRTVRTRTTAPEAEHQRDQVEVIRWKIEKLLEHAAMMLKQLDELEGVDRQHERIAALRQVQGRTPEEAALFLARADELEGQMP